MQDHMSGPQAREIGWSATFHCGDGEAQRTLEPETLGGSISHGFDLKTEMRLEQVPTFGLRYFRQGHAFFQNFGRALKSQQDRFAGPSPDDEPQRLHRDGQH